MIFAILILHWSTSSRFLTNRGTSRRNRNINVHLYATDGLVHQLNTAKQLSYHDATQGELESAECQLESPEYVVHAELKQAHADLRDPFWEPKQRWYAWICFDVFLYVFFTYFFLSFFLSFGSACVGDCCNMMWYFSPVFWGAFFEWSMTLGFGAQRNYTSSATKMWVLSNTFQRYTLWLLTW